MKKTLSILLVLMLVMSFAACTADKDDVRGDVSDNNDASGNIADTDNTVDDDTAEDFSSGSSSGNTYENKFLKMGLSLDENWTFMTDAEIEEQNKQAAEISGLDYDAYFENATMIYDMTAVHSNQTDNLSVTFENLNALSTIAVDEKYYLEVTLDNVKDAYKNMGIEDFQSIFGTTEIAGETHASLKIVLEGYFTQQIIAVKRGNYMASICVTAQDSGTIDEVLAKFYALS